MRIIEAWIVLRKAGQLFRAACLGKILSWVAQGQHGFMPKVVFRNTVSHGYSSQ